MRQAPHFSSTRPSSSTSSRRLGCRPERRLRQARARVARPQASSDRRPERHPEQAAAAFGAGLVTLQGGRDVGPSGRPVRRRRSPGAGAAEPAAGLIITEPVRSGQRIFADGGDLVVVASVGSGAELIARATSMSTASFAAGPRPGVFGDETARIFCQSLEAELVAIAGLYRTSEISGPRRPGSSACRSSSGATALRRASRITQNRDRSIA